MWMHPIWNLVFRTASGGWRLLQIQLKFVTPMGSPSAFTNPSTSHLESPKADFLRYPSHTGPEPGSQAWRFWPPQRSPQAPASPGHYRYLRSPYTPPWKCEAPPKLFPAPHPYSHGEASYPASCFLRSQPCSGFQSAPSSMTHPSRRPPHR